MNRWNLIYTCILLLFLMVFTCRVQTLEAQRLIERDKILNPLENPAVDLKSGENQWFSQFGGWGSFGNYAFSRDANHFWYQELGAYFELYRSGNSKSVAITTQIEFIADDDNDINFSPRAIFWEEGILFTSRRDGFFLQAGYYHRCKHDIDNLNLGEERATVFGSAMGRVIIPVSLSRPGDALFSLRLDYYTITWERRIPRENLEFEPSIEDLSASLMTNIDWRIRLSDQNFINIGGYAMTSLYDADLRSSGKIFFNIGTDRGIGDVQFGFHLEHLADSGIPVRPKAATLAGFGIRINTSGSIR
jgi:hypothetical protein